MLSVLANRTYRHLFAAQAVALVGTGLATVALGLLAHDLAGADAGRVLGTALAIKMIAFVTLAPVMAAVAQRLPRRAMLVGLDLVRAAVVLALPFVTEVWQVYVLILLLQAASAGFTPAFQAVIPDVLPDERDYTRALSLSRLAYDVESLLSPVLAAALLTVVSFPVLFGGTVAGFVLSALLVVSVRLPARQAAAVRPFRERVVRGMWLYLAMPSLRGMLALQLVVASSGAMVIVNTVVIVKSGLSLGASQVALALACYGAGSVCAALMLPRLLDRVADRSVMLAGSALLVAGLATAPLAGGFSAVLLLWLVLGFGYSVVQTPMGRVLRRAATADDRPALFAAQFALSHLCWLVTYPLAGLAGATLGIAATFSVMAALAALGLLAALRLWPALPEHRHDDLPQDHPHLADVALRAGGWHRHAPVGDRWHRP